MLGLKKRIFERKADQFVSSADTEIKILFSSENPSMLGKTISTTALELSPKSLRLEVGYPIEIDSVLDIVVHVNNTGKEYYLTGNVRWRIPSKSDQFHIGLVLRERSDVVSDLKDWKHDFEDNFTGHRHAS